MRISSAFLSSQAAAAASRSWLLSIEGMRLLELHGSGLRRWKPASRGQCAHFPDELLRERFGGVRGPCRAARPPLTPEIDGDVVTSLTFSANAAWCGRSPGSIHRRL